MPLVATAPDQPPDAVQADASVELQVNVEAPPLVTLVGDALIDAVGVAEGCVALVGGPPPQAARSNAAAIVTGVNERMDGISNV